MNTYAKTFTGTLALILLSSSALAKNIDELKSMKGGSPVTFSATVDSVDNEREFTVRDKSGTIDVEITSEQSVVLEKGDKVTIIGKLDKNPLGTEINASKVTVSKNIARAVGDAIEGHTSVSLEGATSYDIKNLPKEGLVKVSGTVSDVDNEKEFTVRDATGSVNVDVKSEETVALTKGAEVTVIGYVDNGMFGKDIQAHKVLVIADATPMAKDHQ